MVDATVFKTEILGGMCGFESHCGHQFFISKDDIMASAREQMTLIQSELAAVREQIARLQAKEEVLVSLLSKLSGEPIAATKQARKRSGSVKPVVLDVMAEVAAAGATSAEVDAKVRQRVPTVAKDTVGSVLSRLKSDGALIFDGDRYYEKRFAPRNTSPFEGTGAISMN